MPDKRERDKRERPKIERAGGLPAREHGRESTISLEFFGYFHHPFNLQVIPDIASSLEELVIQTKGSRLLYLEMPSLSQRQSALFSRLAQEKGLQDTILTVTLANELRRTPTNQETRQRKEQIRNSSLPTIVREGLIPYADIQIYFLGERIDELRRHHAFNIEFEGHQDRDSVEITRTLRQRDEEVDKLRWGEHEFIDSMRILRTELDLDRRQADLREPGVTQDLAKRATLFGRNGGAVFILFGASHAAMIKEVGVKAGQGRTSIKEKVLIHAPAPDYQLINLGALRNGESLSEEMLARQFFGDQCLMALADIFHQGGGRLEDFANNFDSIRAAVYETAGSLSVEDIRRLNNTKTPILTVFLGHTAARVVLPFLH